VVNSAKNDPARKGTGKNARQGHKQADLPTGKKNDYCTVTVEVVVVVAVVCQGIIIFSR
jgi:hypothetical protein